MNYFQLYFVKYLPRGKEFQTKVAGILESVQDSISLGVKRPEREADHSPPSSAEVKECVELYIHSPSTSSWRGAQLKQR